MLKKRVVLAVISATGLFLSATVTAASATEITKDEWLAKIKEVAPAMMCTSFTKNEGINKQLIAASISYDQCVTFIPESYDKCQKQFYSEIPATINKDIAQQWGDRIGDCISTDFSVRHLVSSPTVHPAADAPASPPPS